jgi:hypothetical protein
VRRAAITLVLLLAVTAWPAGARPAPVRPCHAVVDRGVLPVWARPGFSGRRPRMPHTVGRRGQLAALIFGNPLLFPPSKVRSNKILWVARPPWSPRVRNLRLRAQRMRGARPVGRPVTRIVAGGPGPSIIDLPASGCWRVDASWGSHRDQLDLRYRPH